MRKFTILGALVAVMGAGCSDSLRDGEQRQRQDEGDKVTDGCSVAEPVTGFANVSMQVGGGVRTMLRVVGGKVQAGKPMALVIGFHGLGLSGDSPRSHHKWTLVEGMGDGEAVFIYPNAWGGSWNGGRDSHDIRLFDEIVRQTSQAYCIDPKRVFVHGFSNGSFFVNALAQQRASAIRGVISVSGGGNGTNIPAMVIHGFADNNVGYGYAPGLVNSYAKANGCTMPVNFNSLPADQCTALPGCPSEHEVIFCPWRGNHHWPEFTLGTVWNFIDRTKS